MFQKLNYGVLPGLFVTEVLAQIYPGKNDTVFYIPKAKEIKGLILRGNFQDGDHIKGVKCERVMGQFLLEITGF